MYHKLCIIIKYITSQLLLDCEPFGYGEPLIDLFSYVNHFCGKAVYEYAYYVLMFWLVEML